MVAKTLTHLLLSKGYHVILTCRPSKLCSAEIELRSLFAPDLAANADSRLSIESCEINSQTSVWSLVSSLRMRYSKIDEVYLLAANSHVGDSFNNKKKTVETNGQSVLYFMESLYNHFPESRVFFAASSELIGETGNEPFDENTKWNPRSSYGFGKELGARWIDFYKDLGVFACYAILTTNSNTYRPIDYVTRKITNSAAKIAQGKLDKLTLGHIDWARDEFWTDFGCEAMWKMLQLDQPENFVIGNGECHGAEEYLQLAFNYFNLDWRNYVVLSDELKRPIDPKGVVCNPSKAVEKLGWVRNKISFRSHIEILCQFDWMLESGLNPSRPDLSFLD